MSRLAALAGLVGPSHNGGVLATMSTYRLAEEDAARRAYLDVAARAPDRAARQACPECGSGGRHKPGCKQRQVAKVSEARCHVVKVKGKCAAPGCDRLARSKGLCEPHGAQKRRGESFSPLRKYQKRDAPPPLEEPRVGECTRCHHALDLHRGIVCHGQPNDGGRCRCDTGGTPCSKS